MLQGSPEWLALRCGKITGSRFKAAMDRNKRNGQPNKPRRELVRILAAEIATGQPEWTEPNEYMAHGTAMEPIACAAYEFIADVEVQHIAFIQHAELAHVGFSPDGLIGEDGMLEIKCPFLEGRHIRTVESGKCPDDYEAQVQGGMWVAGRAYTDFVSYFPSISVEIVRVYRDEAFIKKLADECASVWSEVQSALTEETA